MREAELIAKKGQPQQIIPTPEGGKILVYENHRMDQVAIMGGGTWDKPEQTYYWLSPQGQVEKTKYFPYGKRKFLFNPDKEPIQAAAAPGPGAASNSTTAPRRRTPRNLSRRHLQDLRASLPQVPQAAAPQKTEPIVAKASAPVPAHKGMKEAAGLELRMSKAEVTRLLGCQNVPRGFWLRGSR